MDQYKMIDKQLKIHFEKLEKIESLKIRNARIEYQIKYLDEKLRKTDFTTGDIPGGSSYTERVQTSPKGDSVFEAAFIKKAERYEKEIEELNNQLEENEKLKRQLERETDDLKYFIDHMEEITKTILIDKYKNKKKRKDISIKLNYSGVFISKEFNKIRDLIIEWNNMEDKEWIEKLREQ